MSRLLMNNRGENGPNCMAMSPLPGEAENSGRSLFRWVLDTDIKGW